MRQDAIIKVELDTDPKALGYVSMTDLEAATAMNDPANDTIEVESVSASDVFEATLQSDWAALTADQKQLYQTMLSMGDLNVKGPNTRATFAALFGAGTTTRANLVALQTRPASRATIIGIGRAREGDVTRARLL